MESNDATTKNVHNLELHSSWLQKHTPLLFVLFLFLFLLLGQQQMVLQSCQGNKRITKVLGIEEMNRGMNQQTKTKMYLPRKCVVLVWKWCHPCQNRTTLC